MPQEENKIGSGTLELSPEREKFLNDYWKKRREKRKAEKAAKPQETKSEAKQ